MLTGSSFLSYQNNDPLKSIRDAIKDSEHHIVRVNDEGTGEVYDLDLSNSAPYASVVDRRAVNSTSATTSHTPADGAVDAHASEEGKSAQHTPSTQNEGSSPTHVLSGRRILQLPQIVSRRTGHPSSSSSASNGAIPISERGEKAVSVASRSAAPPIRQAVLEGAATQQPQQHQQQQRHIAQLMRQPMAGELPPSPPLEPDMQQYIDSTDVSSHDSFPVKSPAGESSRAMNAPKGIDASSTRLTPRRAATEDTLPIRTGFSGMMREPSATSTSSTAYQTAGSQDSGSDGNSSDRIASGQPSRILQGSLTAEPTATLLHPSSAASSSQHDLRASSPSKNVAVSPVRAPLPARRNTTGTPARRRPGSVGSTGTRDSRRSSRERESGQLSGFFDEPVGANPSPHVTSPGGAPLRTGDAGFDDAIAKKYDEIRRERESKKIREQQSAGNKEESHQEINLLRGGSALVRARSGRKPTIDEPKALIGNVISEGHVNYVLMYNMLTGIRIGVSRCQAKMKRPLTDADYTAKHKFTFDIIGNELTPSAKYDFKFKDYAPWVFRELREHFHLDAADYLLSLTAKYILSELGSPGKSGSFFYFSRDYRFIIKTIRHNEHKFLRRILKDYHLHIKENPHTLLSRFYGLHRVKLPGGKKIHFVIMNNLFPPHKDIHETYDLKGSAIGREYPEEKAAQKKGAVLKDLNWIKRGRELEFGPAKRAMLEAQVRSDVALLQRLGIMDYSLLIGLHDMKRGNREGLRQDALQVVQPDNHQNAQSSANGGPPGQLRREPTTRMEKEAYALRAAVRRSDAKALGSSATTKLPERETSDRHHFIFYQDEGGFRSTDESNTPSDWIYYFGIIDTLTLYNSVKRGEHYWKSLTHNSQMISAIHPVAYGNRFCNFLFSLIKGADQSQRPRMQ